jgi:hypothetical protein
MFVVGTGLDGVADIEEEAMSEGTHHRAKLAVYTVMRSRQSRQGSSLRQSRTGFSSIGSNP